MATDIADKKLALTPFLTDDFAPLAATNPDAVAALALPVSPPELGFANKAVKPEGS